MPQQVREALMSIPTPSIEYGQLSPMLIVVGVAVAGLLAEALLPRCRRYGIQLMLSLSGLLAALVAVVALAVGLHGSPGHTAVLGAVAVDGPALFLQATILLFSLLALLLIAERRLPSEWNADTGGLDAFTPQASAIPGSVAEKQATKAGIAQTEVFPLTMFAVGGMLLFPAADDLLTMFVALEVFSLPLYVLCGLGRHRRLLSQEAALKYFLLGAFSSALFLYGIALLYGYAGSFSVSGIADAIANDSPNISLALIGVGLLSVGLLFKVGAVPFHSWIPDVYQGAPTPVTAFMAAATKIAAFGAMLRIFYVAVPGLHDEWRPALWAVAILTMVVGAVMTVTQTDVKRLLAYSAIAHTGFILTGFIAISPAGLSATLIYLFAYGFSTMGAFAAVSLVRNAAGEEDTDLTHWAGLGQRSPVVGLAFSLFLIAMAGIPLTSGFISKFVVFKAAADSGAGELVLVAVASSAVAAFAYARVIGLVFFTEPPDNPARVVVPSPRTTVVVTVGAAVTVVLGIVPQPLLNLADNAAHFLR